MPTGFFTLNPKPICNYSRCREPSGPLGMCQFHHDREIDRRWKALRDAGGTAPRPACFNSDKAWQEYEVFSAPTARVRGRPKKDRVNAAVANPCRDCTPQYQAEMIEEGRCQHPETVFFLRVGSGMEGMNLKSPVGVWMAACSGEMGKVLSAPTPREREFHLRRHA